MKVLMMTDLEGVAGVVSFTSQTYHDGKYYDEARHLLTGEINAAVDAMVAVGVEDILVSDGHGPGAVFFPTLHDPAKLLHGRPPCSRVTRDAVFQAYLEKRYFHTDHADAHSSNDGWERIDSQTVCFRSDDILDIIYR